MDRFAARATTPAGRREGRDKAAGPCYQARMSKPPRKTPGPRGPRKPVRSDARGASPRPPRRDEAGEERPRKRFARPEGEAGETPRRPAGAGAKPFSAGPKRFDAGASRDARAGKEGFAPRKPREDGGKPWTRREDGMAPRARREDGAAPRARRDDGAASRPRREDGFAPRKRRDDAGPARRAPAPQTAPDPDKPLREGDRIAKVMARAGLCSRRDAELWIAEGRVAVNGRTLDTANVVVGEDDSITVDGHPLAKRERTRLFLFHKPRGLVTTDRDPEGRPTIFEAMPADLPRLVTIGRLDINTEGLLLLTNDGGLARVLELPSTGWLRRYRVRAHGETDQSKLDALRLGVTIDGVDYAGVEASLDRVQGGNVWLTMGLREGKNREVKRILEHLGLAVNRLIRLSYGPFHLGDLPEGGVEEVRSRHLRDQLGPQLAAEAGVDFDSPLVERDEAEERVEPRRRIKWREEEDEAEAPRKKKPGPAKRPHVSALRAERGAETERKRSERSQTEDRHGRVVAVERRVRVGGEDEAPKKRKGPPKIAGERRAERGRDLARDHRDAGRPATGRTRDERPRRFGDDAPPRARRFEGDAARPRRAESEGAPRSRRFEAGGEERRGERPYGAAARGPRPEGARFGAPRGERFEGERPARAPRRDGEGRFAAKPFGDRPAGAKSFSAGPRREGEGRGRSEGGEGRFSKPRGEFSPRGERPGGGRSFGEKSFGEKPFGAKAGPRGGKPGFGKPAGDKPYGGRPGGKSFGGKPGGKPFGAKPGGRGPSRGPSGGRPGGRSGGPGKRG
jgi:23S rRNA pseudouridine2605 synthase